MAIRGILFDKDGTLMDVTGTWAPVYRDLLAEIFPGEEARRHRMMEAAGYDAATRNFRAGSVLAGGTTNELVELWWPELDAAGRARQVRALEDGYTDLTLKYFSPLMPLAPVLQPLSAAGYRMGVATNDGEQSARRHMASLGASHYFEVILGWDSVASPKPAGDMVRRFADLTGLAPGEVAMVGDNPHDMDAARDGGAGLAIAVLTGNAAHGDIAHLADHTIESVADLPLLLAGL